MVALGASHLARDGPPGALEGMGTDRGRQQARADHPPATGAGALMQRGNHAVRPVHPGQQVRDRHPYTGRLARTGAGEAHQAGLALRDLVVPGAPALGAVVAEPGDREHHEPRVQLVQPADREAEPIENPRPEVLQEHVGPLDESAQQILALGRLEVGSDGLLVAVAGQEVRRHRVVVRAEKRRSPGAAVVAGDGALHLDHPGAEVAEHHRRVRAGQRPGQIDDDDVLEGSGHVRHRMRRPRAPTLPARWPPYAPYCPLYGATRQAKS